MGTALSIAAKLMCPHGFPIAPTAGSALTIGGSPIVVGGTFTPACTAVDNSVTTHCATVMPANGLAAALTVGGVPVVLSSVVLTTSGVPPAPSAITPEAPAPLSAS